MTSGDPRCQLLEPTVLVSEMEMSCTLHVCPVHSVHGLIYCPSCHNLLECFFYFLTLSNSCELCRLHLANISNCDSDDVCCLCFNIKKRYLISYSMFTMTTTPLLCRGKAPVTCSPLHQISLDSKSVFGLHFTTVTKKLRA